MSEAPTFSAEERFAAYDALGRYVWALDSGDVDGVLRAFTAEDCRFVDTRGNVHEGAERIRAMVTSLVRDPDFRGRQHIVTHLCATREGDEAVVRSYWTVVKWSFDRAEKQIFSTGHSTDRLVSRDGHWLIRERALGWFTDRHGPWVGA